MSQEIIGMGDWLQSPPGQHVLAWEQRQFGQAVCDVFGFHAVQLGLPQIPALGESRIPRRWVLANEADLASPGSLGVPSAWADPGALPFADNSIDLLVLPHTLELCADPHGVLREVERVLVPQGRVVLSLFNPLSLWGARQGRAFCARRMGWRWASDLFFPQTGGLIAPWRARDWLSLMNLEVQFFCHGIYGWPTHSAQWLQRQGWMDALGQRWWPVLGAVYVAVAVKRVRGVRLLGPAWHPRRLVVKPSRVVVPLEMPAPPACASPFPPAFVAPQESFFSSTPTESKTRSHDFE